MKKKHNPPSSSSNSDSIHVQPKKIVKAKAKAKAKKKDPKPSAKRSSVYKGVTRHRSTGRFEAHLWDKDSCSNVQNKTKKGKQIYLGAHKAEEAAARTYDLAALKYWGPETFLNFPIFEYAQEMAGMQNLTNEEYLVLLRRKSSGFSRGISKYRGVTRHHHNGRWEARIGRVRGNKYTYLGTYTTQEEAAMAYDKAAIEYRGVNAITNFDISSYTDYFKEKFGNEGGERLHVNQFADILDNVEAEMVGQGPVDTGMAPMDVVDDSDNWMMNLASFEADLNVEDTWSNLSMDSEFLNNLSLELDSPLIDLPDKLPDKLHDELPDDLPYEFHDDLPDEFPDALHHEFSDNLSYDLFNDLPGG